MKLTKLNSKGVAHIIVPLIVVVGVGLIGSYIAVKSRSHADSLTGSTQEAQAPKNLPTQDDNQAASLSAADKSAAAAELTDPDGGTAPSQPTNTPASAKTNAAVTPNGASPSFCQANGYDGYSAHYGKCINLRYSYSSGSKESITNHTSANHSFGTKFEVRYSASCGPVAGTDLKFYSNTLKRTWVDRFLGTGSNGKNFSSYIYSDIAQSLRMYFHSEYCTYTVHIWQ